MDKNKISFILDGEDLRMFSGILDGTISVIRDDVENLRDRKLRAAFKKEGNEKEKKEYDKLCEELTNIEKLKENTDDLICEPAFKKSLIFKLDVIETTDNGCTIKIENEEGVSIEVMKLPKWFSFIAGKIKRNTNIEEVDEKLSACRKENAMKVKAEGDMKMEDKRKIEDFAETLKEMNQEGYKENKLDKMPEPDIRFATEEDYKKLSEAFKAETASEECGCKCDDGDCGGCCQEKQCKCGCSSNHEEDEEETPIEAPSDIEIIEDDLCEALDDILENIDYVKNLIYTEGKCKKCGGYILFNLSDPQLEILKMLGLTLPEDAQYCICQEIEESHKEDVNKALEWIKSKETKSYVKEYDENKSLTQNLKEYRPAFEIGTLVTQASDISFCGHEYLEETAADLRRKEILDALLSYEVEINWATKEGVDVPSKSDEDLGYDIKAHFDEDEMVFQPFETKLVPTGVYAAMPNKHWGLIAKEKGSTGALAMRCGAGVIDSGYRDEIFIALTNANPYPLVISKDPNLKKPEMRTVQVQISDIIGKEENRMYYPYTKGICQLILVRNIQSKSNVLSIEELQQMPSKRGTGKLGSTDNL